MQDLLILLRKDFWEAANALRAGRRQSRFKQIFIALFAMGLLAGLWRLFLDGFRFISALGGVGTLIIQRLFSLFFFSLGIMLFVSSLITAYAVIFRSAETPFLILSPVPHGRRILHQWLTVTMIAAWAFFFMIVPFVGAYAVHERMSLLFVAWTLALSVPFVLLCCGIGTLLTLTAVRWLPRVHPVWLGLALAAFAAWWWWRAAIAAAPERTDDAVFMLVRLVPGLRLAAFPLWPSHWVADGILAFSRGHWSRGLWLSAVLLSNLLMTGLLIAALGRAWFYQAWQRSLEPRAPAAGWAGILINPRRAGASAAPLGAWAGKALFFLRQDYRALVLKDWRQLLRDPVQWTQGAVFFCLLAVYFLNLRNFNYHMLSPVWRNLIAFLNIFSLAAIMSSFCSRFVYPQMSLEGQGCWMLGLSPVSMGRVLLVKYAAALAGMLLVSGTLLLISTAMLKVDPGVRVVAIAIALAMSAALCALATGLGAIFMDLRQRNPVVIISGFGGTLNLALSLGYMIAAILPFSTLYHWYHLERITAPALRHGVTLASLWLLALTALTVVVPLALARRSLMRREY